VAGEELTFTDLYNDLVDAHRVRTPPPLAFTARKFADDTERSVGLARRVLADYVEEGILACGDFPSPVDDRATARHYWFVNDDNTQAVQ